MSGVAVFLIAVGCADILRRLAPRPRLAVFAGPLIAIATAALCGLWHLGDLVPVGIGAVGAALWELACTRAERRGGRSQVLPLVLFAGILAVLIVLSGLGSTVGGPVAAWVRWASLPGLGTVEPARVVMVIAVVLLQLVTGNQLVRLLLGSVGSVKPAGQPQASDRLKGGRLLGPMERLLILGLSLAGQLTAATAVVAAKSIIRFPEINAQRARENGASGIGGQERSDPGITTGGQERSDPGITIDDVTEYFLVGSFASWIVALGGLALAQ
ncbi:hypothetical protein MANY_32830 [Mycolicibacterium anyangense]|uniref:Uncharacterized protein n=1 Tax=Mycolicibacterium anyangense TaxID=1431246 RepID=A0A6N4W7K6_9MYCO|nr:hypothetical protein [Mycolicibacterium anyangense]BBZ77946.1 hypothetical protein MANY_32830 [Mycolicibacterium anyangense]